MLENLLEIAYDPKTYFKTYLRVKCWLKILKNIKSSVRNATFVHRRSHMFPLFPSDQNVIPRTLRNNNQVCTFLRICGFYGVQTVDKMLMVIIVFNMNSLKEARQFICMTAYLCIFILIPIRFFNRYKSLYK